MFASVLSPCVHCQDRFSGMACCSREKARCSRFLEYIESLSKARAHCVLIKELKLIITK
jgi:hypothetical protein